MNRIYRTNGFSKLFFFVFLSISLLFIVGTSRKIASGEEAWLELAISTMLALAGAAGVVQTFTQRIELTDDSILFGSLFGWKSLRLDQIRYRREYEDSDGETNTSYLELIAYDGAKQSIRISKDDFDLDHAFWYWMRQIPELEDLNPSSLRI